MLKREQINQRGKISMVDAESLGQLADYKGKKVYGYLPKNIKQTVSDIVAELAKDERIAELYAEWNKANREKLSVYYDKKKPDIPLEENKEFRDIKNAIIRSAVLMMQNEHSVRAVSINSSVGKLVIQLAKAIASSFHKRRASFNGLFYFTVYRFSLTDAFIFYSQFHRIKYCSLHCVLIILML